MDSMAYLDQWDEAEDEDPITQSMTEEDIPMILNQGDMAHPASENMPRLPDSPQLGTGLVNPDTELEGKHSEETDTEVASNGGSDAKP